MEEILIHQLDCKQPDRGLVLQGDIMSEMHPDLVAPCGMNCRLCHAYQREMNHCNGCRNELDIAYRIKSMDIFGGAQCR